MAGVIERLAHVAGSVLVAVATATVIVALAVIPFLNPAWVALEQGRAEAAAWTGYSPPELRAATDAILADLVVGPPDFDVLVAGSPVLTPAEREHMRDVRGVFVGLAVVAALSAVGLVVATRRAGTRRVWRAIRSGALALAIGIGLVGLVGLVAFDAAFEVFHRLFFATGSYTFDPRTDRLVQLFPQRFWFETSLAVGVTILGLAAATAWLASRRLRASAPASVPSRQTIEAIG